MESKRSTSTKRAQDSLTEMGVSVISGAITTFGAAFFLLLTQMEFFKMFGTYMAATIVFSITFSLVLLMALAIEFGPVPKEDGSSTGDIMPLLHKLGLGTPKVAPA
jgi:predicted RND superfamily exporter protein